MSDSSGQNSQPIPSMGQSSVPGQTVLPGMVDTFGYESIVLKPSLEKFCWEFVLRNDSPATAYIAAISPDCEREQARKNSHKLLKKEDVRRRIEEIRAELKRRYAVSVEDLMQYHGKVMKIDRDEYLDPTTGQPRKLAEISAEARSILEFDCEKDSKGNIKVLFKVPQRHQSSVEMARILGLHKDGEAAAKAGVSGLRDLLDEISSRHEHRDIVKERGGQAC